MTDQNRPQCRRPGSSVDVNGRPTRVASRVVGDQQPCHDVQGHSGDCSHDVSWRRSDPNSNVGRPPSRTRDFNRANDGADW